MDIDRFITYLELAYEPSNIYISTTMRKINRVFYNQNLKTFILAAYRKNKPINRYSLINGLIYFAPDDKIGIFDNEDNKVYEIQEILIEDSNILIIPDVISISYGAIDTKFLTG